MPGYYIVEYVRVMEDGLTVAHDKTPYRDETRSDMYSDVMRVFIDDDGIFRVTGFYREYSETSETALAVSLDDAIEILHENMDYANFHSEDNRFEIGEISLCYRLVQTLATHDKDVNARLEARPAWRFASTVNQNMTDEFVVFIDAVTGEVLE